MSWSWKQPRAASRLLSATSSGKMAVQLKTAPSKVKYIQATQACIPSATIAERVDRRICRMSDLKLNRASATSSARMPSRMPKKGFCNCHQDTVSNPPGPAVR